MQINVINKQSTHIEYSHRTHIELIWVPLPADTKEVIFRSLCVHLCLYPLNKTSIKQGN